MYLAGGVAVAVQVPDIGSDARVTFLDHCESDGVDSAGLVVCTVYGKLVEIGAGNLFITVESWATAEDTHRSRTRYSIAVSTVTDISVATWRRFPTHDRMD